MWMIIDNFIHFIHTPPPKQYLRAGGGVGGGGGGGGSHRAVLHADAPPLPPGSIPDGEDGALLHVGGLPACAYYAISGVTRRVRSLEFDVCRREQSAGVSKALDGVGQVLFI